ncbi:MAG: CPBP family intramembrane metalloprotease [Bacillota bacterium]|nr:CPBP family intramembrane metalloprotease [Bacillota bacterium]
MKYWLAEALMGLEGAVLLWVAGIPLRGLIGLENPWRSFFLGVAAGLVVLAAVWAVARRFPPRRARQDAVAFGQWVMGLSPLGLVAFMLVTAAGEELFFRGAVQTIALQLLSSAALAIATSTLIFTALHLRSSVVGIFSGVANGAVLGLLFWATGSLWAPVLAHAVYNVGFILSQRRAAAKAAVGGDGAEQGDAGLA